MTTPQNIFIQELDNFISNAGYATNTVPITRLNDLETLKNLAIQAGCFTGESLEKFRLVLSQRLEMKDKDVENEIRKLRVRQALGQRLITMTHYDILCRLRSPQMVAIVPRMNRSTVVEGHRRAECRQKSAPNRQPASLPHRVVRS